MEEIMKVGIIAILGVLAALQLKGTKPEFSICIGITLGMFIFGYTVRQLQQMLGGLGQMGGMFAGSKGYLSILIKVIGITYLCEFSAAICKDAGFATVADQIEVLGKLSVMFAGLPILLALLELIQSYTM